ncbi:PREDICTED: uncharacterized protein LOC109592757 isoform X1 [Amphimedon queenslandica]|uniref:3'-5' exonuclease domain-containing protein n=1 Tax=Amphimedon queenslandica TaxID=400682 RepID=A0A1X7VKS8_AMPQE|nr:PREDICTED: uncharacterized protein LOC109592757 isoform X1 [Amphimedon queenslandica]|eukprot:XP_019863694.1 PREDICTED: uncharacterized protein LOC109592757 isoform X1 [Amphimedon queenslandica]
MATLSLTCIRRKANTLAKSQPLILQLHPSFSFPKILSSPCSTVSPLGPRQIAPPAPKIISKLDVKRLPGIQFKGKVYVLKENNDECRFQREISELCRSGVLGFDTETTSQFFRGRYLPSLVQLSNENTCVMWRLRKVNENSGATSTWISHTLTNILMSPDILKVGHGSFNDVKDLLLRYHLETYNFQDTYQLAVLLGLENLSLRGLVGLFLNKKLDKSHTISNWEAPSLTNEQITYAATDAWASLKVYHCIVKEAKRCKKEFPSPITRAFHLLKPFYQEKILDRINRIQYVGPPPQAKKQDGNKSSDKISEVQGEQGHDGQENDHPTPPLIKPTDVYQDDDMKNIAPTPRFTKPNGPKRFSSQDEVNDNIDPTPRVTKPNGPKHSSQDDINDNIDPIPRVIKPKSLKRSSSGSKSTAVGSYGPPIVERDVYERRTIERWFVDPEGKPLMQPYTVEKKYKEMHREQNEDASEKMEQ